MKLQHFAKRQVSTFTAVFIAVIMVSSLAASPVEAAAKSRGTIFFEGDSITALYNNNPRSKDQGYWSKLAKKLNMKPVVDAQGGSGFLKPGEKHPKAKNKKMCDGTTFAQRLKKKSTQKKVKKAKIVVIEGGKNDFHKCLKNGVSKDQLVPTSSAEIAVAANDYMDMIAAIRAGQDPATVYVITPWADHTDFANKKQIVPIVRKAAAAHGFQWVDMNGVLDPHYRNENTKDGIHPDQKGTTAIANAFVSRSDIKRRANF